MLSILTSMELKEIENLSDLARLSLTEEEMSKFGEDFDSILGYVKQLGEVADVSEDNFMLTNRLRVDEVNNESSSDEMLEQAPDKHGRYVKVQKIISTSDE